MTHLAPVYPRPKRTGRTVVIVLTVLAFLGACGVGAFVLTLGAATTAAVSADPESSAAARLGVQAWTPPDHAKDVKILSCAADQFGMIKVKYKITNSSGGKLSYLPQFDVMRGGERVASPTGIAGDVPAGGTVRGEAVDVIAEDTKGKITCKLRSA